MSDIDDMVEEMRKLRAERDQWKANHDNQVAIKAAVLDRPDLGDRAKRVLGLIEERDELRAALTAIARYDPPDTDYRIHEVMRTMAHAALGKLEWRDIGDGYCELVSPCSVAELRAIIRRMFYMRLPTGGKLEHLIEATDENLLQACFAALKESKT